MTSQLSLPFIMVHFFFFVQRFVLTRSAFNLITCIMFFYAEIEYNVNNHVMSNIAHTVVLSSTLCLPFVPRSFSPLFLSWASSISLSLPAQAAA